MDIQFCSLTHKESFNKSFHLEPYNQAWVLKKEMCFGKDKTERKVPTTHAEFQITEYFN